VRLRLYPVTSVATNPTSLWLEFGGMTPNYPRSTQTLDSSVTHFLPFGFSFGYVFLFIRLISNRPQTSSPNLGGRFLTVPRLGGTRTDGRGQVTCRSSSAQTCIRFRSLTFLFYSLFIFALLCFIILLSHNTYTLFGHSRYTLLTYYSRPALVFHILLLHPWRKSFAPIGR
jgi:hypothetical protein